MTPVGITNVLRSIYTLPETPARIPISLAEFPGLVEADETPAAVIIRWPVEPTVLHPHRFPSAADGVASIFATAVVRLAQIRRDRRL